MTGFCTLVAMFKFRVTLSHYYLDFQFNSPGSELHPEKNSEPRGLRDFPDYIHNYFDVTNWRCWLIKWVLKIWSISKHCSCIGLLWSLDETENGEEQQALRTWGKPWKVGQDEDGSPHCKRSSGSVGIATSLGQRVSTRELRQLVRSSTSDLKTRRSRDAWGAPLPSPPHPPRTIPTAFRTATCFRFKTGTSFYENWQMYNQRHNKILTERVLVNTLYNTVQVPTHRPHSENVMCL
jgi:hypothetical protein